MNYTVRLLAKKYARAYLNIYPTRITRDVLCSFDALADYLDTHPLFSLYIKLASIPLSVKQQFVQRLCTQFYVYEQLEAIILLLVAHDRLFLLAPVVRLIHAQYLKVHHYEEFRVTSAYPLPIAQQHTIEQFLHRHTGKKIIATYVADPQLIAGIRMISNTLLWEHSIAKQLRAINSLL